MSVYVSALDLFSIGIGPSSSHTVGPMRAAGRFVAELAALSILPRLTHIECTLYGSLAATGVGHGTPDAVVAGLAGERSETCDPAAVHGAWARATESGLLQVRDRDGAEVAVPFNAADLTFEPRTRMPEHPNALTLRAHVDAPEPAIERTYFSIGGGFVTERGAASAADSAQHAATEWPFSTAAELLALCARYGLGVCDVAYRVELERRGESEVVAGLDAIRQAMHDCIERGLYSDGELPGGLHVPRRAKAMREQLEATPPDAPDFAAEWMRAFALAVNEENAAGSRVVTAPTNGAAGIVPAVLEYHLRFNPRATDADARRYLLTAAAIGSILKANASISGAEGGCQAEVGSACAMAAAGLCAVLGGTPDQVENAAEIAVEHHLGLTCDPVGGLVQIPCIERNAIAASTAVSAARLALHGDGRHLVPLDVAVETMRQTGADMSDRYKETSAAGLAVNVIEC